MTPTRSNRSSTSSSASASQIKASEGRFSDLILAFTQKKEDRDTKTKVVEGIVLPPNFVESEPTSPVF